MVSAVRRGTRASAWALVIAGACSGTLLGQSVRVNAAGGGHFTDLQTALDTVPPGTTVRVQGGTWPPVVVRKSLRIVGEPSFEILVQNHSLAGTGGVVQDRALTLAGNGSDLLEVSHATIRGRVPGVFFAESSAAIAGHGFASLRLVSCYVEGPRWENVVGRAVGKPAIELPPGTGLLLADCIVAGASSDDCCSSGFGFGARGAAGIEAPGCEVTVLDSIVAGGNGVPTYWVFAPPANSACPCTAAPPNDSQGGPAIVAANLLEANSAIQGGLGGEVWFDPGTGYRAWGRQPDGPPVVSASRTTWSDDVTVSYGRHLGEILLLKDNSQRFSLVLLGSLATHPFAFGSNAWIYLDLGLGVVVQPLSPNGQYQIPIPLDVFLIGQLVGTHFLGYPAEISRPLVTVIRA